MILVPKFLKRHINTLQNIWRYQKTPWSEFAFTFLSKNNEETTPKKFVFPQGIFILRLIFDPKQTNMEDNDSLKSNGRQ